MNISEKISFYDFLTMLVTGFVILFMLIPWNCIEEYWILITVFSYIVGLFYHRFLEWLGAKIGKRKPSIPFFFGTILFRNYDKALEKMKNKHEDNKKNKHEDNKLTEIEKEYYSAYYYIMDKPCHKTISVLETQVAFTRDISLLLIGLCISSFIKKDWLLLEVASGLKIGVFFIVLYVMSLIVCYFTQLKIYELVWEGYKYTKPLEKKEVINQNQGLFVCNNTNVYDCKTD